MRICLLAVMLVLLWSPGQCADFSDSDQMFNAAHSLGNMLDDESVQGALKYAREQLAEAKGENVEEGALQAFFAAVYASLKLPHSGGKDAQAVAECLAKSAKLLGLPQDIKPYVQRAAEFVKGRLPDHCGISRGAVPVTNEIAMLTLDNGIGQLRNVYYYPGEPLGEYDEDCGKIQGPVCYQELKRAPATEKMRQSGVKDNEMIFIHQCVMPD